MIKKFLKNILSLFVVFSAVSCKTKDGPEMVFNLNYKD
jgi:hypothetical protein